MANAPLSYKNDEDKDARLNPEELAKREQVAGESSSDYAKAGADQAEAYANDPANASQAELQAREDDTNTFSYSAGGANSPTRSARAILKRFGPTGGIIGVIIGAVLGGSLFFSPGLLLVQVKEIFTNYNSSASRAAVPRYNMLLRNIIGGDAEKNCAKSAGIRCRIGTMSEKQKQTYERAGFKLETEEVNGRHIVKSATFPDGTEVKNGAQFTAYAKRNHSALSASLRAFNPKTAIFNAGNRFALKVLSPLGVNKARFALDGNDDKERTEDFDKKARLGPVDEIEVDGKVRGKLAKGGAVKAKNIVGVLCGSYGLARAALGAAKLEAGLRLVRFAVPFLKVADQIKAKGDVDPNTVSTLGTMLTKTDVSGEKKGLSATDSQGYKVAAYGGEGQTKEFTKAYLLGGNKNLLRIENLLDKSAEPLGGRGKARKVCRGVNSYGATIAECAVLAETIVGPFICTGVQIIAGFVVGTIVGQLIGKAMPFIVKAILGTNISSSLYGVDAGNALAAGAGFMMLKSNLSKGMKPSKKADVSKFLAATLETDNEYEVAAREDAKQTPFDVYNEYSFLGSLVRSSGVTYSSDSSLAQVTKNIGSLALSGLNIIPKTFAAASMPVNVTDEDLSHCAEVDKDLADIGVDCDLVGGVQGSMSPEELSMTVEDNLDYMINKKFIDENSGEAIPDTSYAEWVKYCTDNRQDVLGSSSSSPEDKDYDWQVGANCVQAVDSDVSEEDLSNFRVYYNTLSMKEEADGVEGTGSIGKVMTWNVLGADKDGVPPWSTRKVYILNEIKAKSPDIIGLQEMNEDVQFEDIESGLPEYGLWDGGVENDGGGRNERPILWKSAVYDKVDGGIYKHQRYSDNEKQPAPWIKLKKKSDGSEVFVFNYHGIAHDSNADKKVEGAEDLVDAVNNIADSSTPVVVLGDFNSNYGEFAHPVILAAGFVDTFQVAQQKINADYETHHDAPPAPRTKGTKHIDHIFVRPSMPVPLWENVIDENTTNASDHTPIIATIEGLGINASAPAASDAQLKLGLLCTINDPSLTESSGLAASVKHPGVVYTHNDEGNTIYAIDAKTCAVLGKFNVQGVRSDPDPEAIQVDHKTGKIWFGDIGNGHPNQPFSDKAQKIKHPGWPARVVVFDEPAQFSGTISNTQALNITYSNGDQNSEALLANPVTGQGYIINKGPQSTLYKLPYPITSGKAVDTGVRIPGWVTDASFTNDGKWVLIRYRTANDAAPTNVYVYNAQTWKLDGNITVPKVTQGESITVEKDGASFLIGSEGKNSPLVRVAIPPQYGGSATPTVPGGGGSSSTGINLSIWKLTLPVGSSGSPTEITQPKLATFEQKPYFWKDGDAIRFLAPAGGVTTSGSSYPRSELREMKGSCKNGEACWSNSSGNHEMTITEAILSKPTDTQRVVAGQIHDAEDDVVKILLDKNTLYASFGLGKGNGDKNLLLDPNYRLGTKFTLKIAASGGKTTVTYNGSKTVSYSRAYSGAYFKAGVYTQSSKKGAGNGEVTIYSLVVRHS